MVMDLSRNSTYELLDIPNPSSLSSPSFCTPNTDTNANLVLAIVGVVGTVATKLHQTNSDERVKNNQTDSYERMRNKQMDYEHIEKCKQIDYEHIQKCKQIESNETIQLASLGQGSNAEKPKLVNQ